MIGLIVVIDIMLMMIITWTYKCVASSYTESDEVDIGQDFVNEVFIDHEFYGGGDPENDITFYWK